MSEKPATGAGFSEIGKDYLLFLMCLIKRLRLRIWFGVRVLRLFAKGFPFLELNTDRRTHHVQRLAEVVHQVAFVGVRQILHGYRGSPR